MYRYVYVRIYIYMHMYIHTHIWDSSDWSGLQMTNTEDSRSTYNIHPTPTRRLTLDGPPTKPERSKQCSLFASEPYNYT